MHLCCCCLCFGAEALSWLSVCLSQQSTGWRSREGCSGAAESGVARPAGESAPPPRFPLEHPPSFLHFYLSLPQQPSSPSLPHSPPMCGSNSPCMQPTYWLRFVQLCWLLYKQGGMREQIAKINASIDHPYIDQEFTCNNVYLVNLCTKRFLSDCNWSWILLPWEYNHHFLSGCHKVVHSELNSFGALAFPLWTSKQWRVSIVPLALSSDPANYQARLVSFNMNTNEGGQVERAVT